MAKAVEAVDPSVEGRELGRISRLLALLAVKGEEQADKVLTLSAVGFTAAEISELLRITSNNVAVTIYRSKTAKKKRKRR